MERSIDDNPLGSERSRASGEPPLENPQFQTKHPGPSTQNSSFTAYGSGDQFNAPNGNQNITKGPGNQFPGSSFQGPVYFDTTELFDPLRECLQSLAFPEMDSRFHDTNAAAEGTCKWLLRHKKYTSWASCDRGLLWIKGKPGSGKSTLIRYVLDHVMPIPNTTEGALILSFFFHGRGSELQKTPLGLFRSILHQLLRQVPEALTDLVATFQQRCETVGKPGEKWQWHPHELPRLFESSLPKVLETRPVWLFVDALDECGKENAVNLAEEFNALLQRLPSCGLKQFRICFTRRHYPILVLDGVLEVCVEEENRNDISTFVQDKLSSFRGRTSSTIPELITNRANGVFLWAWLVVKRVLDLERKGAGLKKIEAVILSVPQELDALYRDLIRNMGSDSLKLIQWICFAMRPLSLDELRWAMLVDADCPHWSLYECQAAGDYPSDHDGMKRRVQTLSRGLAEVTSPVHQGFSCLEGSISSERVQFIHQSVKDFFVEKGLSVLDWPKWVMPFIYQSAKNILIEKGPSTPDDSPRICLSTALIGLATAFVYLNFFMRGSQSFLPDHTFPLPIVLAVISAFWLHGESVANTKSKLLVGTAHHRLSRTCIRYLAMEEIGRSANHKRSDLMSEFPFLHYVTTSWVAHMKQSDARGVSQMDLLDYFAWPSNALVERWVRIYRILETYSRDCPTEGTSLVHVMSRYGVAGALWVILERAVQVGINIDAKDSDGRTPLMVAAENGHKAVVRLLLDRGAHIEAVDNGGRTPLWWAAEKGHEAVVRLLQVNIAQPSSTTLR
ncbi:hypothetical protein FOXB_06703 [Fusarium oxysporum f. sp. conglutinans Fo5176]|uniref:Uncharacterized protein n=2 Tax=Fusarium oxysporum f. sp. conglutinans TaxID=100902 RepID=F9FJX4_FUSOF|nr:hypothetical protein FOXB_06703 [Fusarium oxysporum f. sp. conglutinans Fo5176]KAI8405749.1 hypothetical protein FOFC_15237 [Fusarium oxysporum]